MAREQGETVLVVEDEEALVEIYSRWLEDDYEVRSATSGEAALEVFDDDVDVVLLDRLMPGMSGDEVLAAIRERNPDCKVTMVTAVEPDFDIITMGFDDYLTKPVDRDELKETVARLIARTAFADLEQELYALSSKRAALESAKSPTELEGNDEFLDLRDRIGELRERLDDAMGEVGDDDFVAMVRDLERDDEMESPNEPGAPSGDSGAGDADAGEDGAGGGHGGTGDDADRTDGEDAERGGGGGVDG